MSRKFGLTDAEWQRLKSEVRGILRDVARDGQTITYGQLSTGIQSTRIHPHSYALATLLREICEAEEQSERGLLCALVVRKQTGIPGGGFFKIAARFGRDVHDWERCWQQEITRLFDGYDTS